MNAEEQLKTLNRLINHCKKAPFYQKRLPEQPLGSLDDFYRLPLVTKEDLRENSPFGLICVPQNELYQYHESFGTTGTPVSVWLTKEDFMANAEEYAQLGVNLGPDDVIMVRFPYAISNIAHIVTAAAHLCESCVVPAGARSTVSPFPRVVDLLRKLRVTVLACLPIQVLLIAETAELMGFDPRADFPELRAICTAGEPLSPAKRKILTGIWGVPVYDNYGMTEIGAAVVDCEHGRPHPLDEYFFYEILRDDLRTHAGSGEIGFLVVTTLRRNGTPLIRYLTGDRARITEQKCSCGKTGILEVRGRIEHTIQVGPRRFDLWDLEEIAFQLPCRRFWVVGPVPDGLQFVIENESLTEVPPELLKKLEEIYHLKIQAVIVPKGALYDRDQLLSVGVVGKPQYIYSAQEMAERMYLKSTRI